MVRSLITSRFVVSQLGRGRDLWILSLSFLFRCHGFVHRTASSVSGLSSLEEPCKTAALVDVADVAAYGRDGFPASTAETWVAACAVQFEGSAA